jgi:PhnB protein
VERTLTPNLAPYLVARNAPGLIEFVLEAIGGKLSFKGIDNDGRVAHAEIQIGDALVMVGEASLRGSPFPAMLHLYVKDADAAYRRALEAGATDVSPPTDAPDGHRRAGVKDNWGNEWWFSSPTPRARG